MSIEGYGVFIISIFSNIVLKAVTKDSRGHMGFVGTCHLFGLINEMVLIISCNFFWFVFPCKDVFSLMR